MTSRVKVFMAAIILAILVAGFAYMAINEWVTP